MTSLVLFLGCWLAFGVLAFGAYTAAKPLEWEKRLSQVQARGLPAGFPTQLIAVFLAAAFWPTWVLKWAMSKKAGAP